MDGLLCCFFKRKFQHGNIYTRSYCLYVNINTNILYTYIMYICVVVNKTYRSMLYVAICRIYIFLFSGVYFVSGTS